MTCGKRKPLERVPYVQREWVEDVASSTTEQVWDDRHGDFICQVISDEGLSYNAKEKQRKKLFIENKTSV